ncbi:hypothetical protein LZ30DRAFT_706002 [Colletotrichum cereale]|nr:hypothetical protein LZ30DRAFT_706002 [Colletotrichum cereale]
MTSCLPTTVCAAMWYLQTARAVTATAKVRLLRRGALGNCGRIHRLTVVETGLAWGLEGELNRAAHRWIDRPLTVVGSTAAVLRELIPTRNSSRHGRPPVQENNPIPRQCGSNPREQCFVFRADARVRDSLCG